MLHLLLAKFRAVSADRRGITAMEYGVLAAAVIGVVATAAVTIGADISSLFNTIVTDLNTAASKLGS